jgi:hypothetical protein
MDIDELPELCTTAQLAEILQTKASCLAQDRYRGYGIPYIKVGRRIRYRRQDVIDYLQRNSTVPDYPISNWAATAHDAGRQKSRSRRTTR